MELIDKSALVAEIKRRKKIVSDPILSGSDLMIGERNAYFGLLSFINSLEVKEDIKIGKTQIYLNDDGGEPPYDGKQWLDLSCTEYEIPSDKFKDGDNVEIIIRKTQKE